MILTVGLQFLFVKYSFAEYNIWVYGIFVLISQELTDIVGSSKNKQLSHTHSHAVKLYLQVLLIQSQM